MTGIHVFKQKSALTSDSDTAKLWLLSPAPSMAQLGLQGPSSPRIPQSGWVGAGVQNQTNDNTPTVQGSLEEGGSLA